MTSISASVIPISTRTRTPGAGHKRVRQAAQPGSSTSRTRARQRPILGLAGDTECAIDVETLTKTRLFIQASPGGGKSYTLRRILEQTYFHIQQIVIDPEGELVTLADKFDYLVLSADSEETPLRTASAGELAQRLWRSGHSVILCLEAFEIEEMQEFVAAFLKGLMVVRKEDWSPILLAIDEGQLVAPQQDKAESKKPMLDVCARGRKRGICPVVATQRVSQIHKGVVGHLQNHCVGLTTLDIDLERAADLLGIKLARATEILRSLKPGEFLTFGPALGNVVSTVKVGPVQTRHGELGRFANRRRRPMAKTKILGVIKQLGTAPEAEALTSDGQENPRQRIAEFRRWVISPLLAKDAQRGATAERCRQLGLSQVEVGRWLAVFKERYDLQDLMPLRVRDTMIQDMVRLSTLMLQDAAHHREQPSRKRLRAA